MTPYFLKFFGIYFACLFKFIAGPVLGSAAGFNLLEIMAMTIGGMMSSVLITTYLGEWVKSYFTVSFTPKRKKFTSRTRRIVKVWQKFGPFGIAGLTPLFLTPIGGTIIMLAFYVKPRKILTYMLFSATIWAFILGSSIKWILSIPFFDHLLR